MLYDLGKSLNESLQRLFKGEVTDGLIENTVRDIIRQLISNNVGTKCILELKRNIDDKIKATKINPGINKAKFIYTIIFDELVRLIDPQKPPYKIKKGKTQIVLFVGLQGSGKTTTICKYANFYKKKGFKTGIVCADTFRAGAFDQIKQNALKINVPYFGSNELDPVKVSKEGIEKFKREHFELILVDTSGRHTQENDLFLEMKEIIKNIKPDNIIFVVDAGIGQSAEQQSLGFKENVKLGSIILSKTDGAEKAGGAISSIAVTKCPIEFIGTGEKMTDLELFEPKRFINKIMGKGDLEGLFDKFQDIDQTETIEKFKKGQFSLRDFQGYINTFLSLGPISNISSMIPGMPKLPDSADQLFKQMVYVFDSMTEKELDSEGTALNQSRKIRIAKGSGTSLELINQLLLQYQTFYDLFKHFRKDKMFMSLLDQDPSKINANDINKLQKRAVEKMKRYPGKLSGNNTLEKSNMRDLFK